MELTAYPTKAIHARCNVIDIQVDRLLEIAELPEDRLPDIDPENHAGNAEKTPSQLVSLAAMGLSPESDPGIGTSPQLRCERSEYRCCAGSSVPPVGNRQ